MDTSASNPRRNPVVRSRTLLALTGVLAVGLMAGLVYYAADAYVLAQAEARIRDVMLESRALHWYVQRNMHPALYQAKAEGRLPQGFYAPEILSSTCIARNLYDHYNEGRKEAGLPEVQYRLAAIDPRNPLNEAGPRERALIEMFNRQPTRSEHREVIEIDGRKHLYYAIPFLPNERRCLKCHGDPEAAPQELREYYDWQGGYHRQVGDIVAVESVSTPLEAEFHLAHVALAGFLGGAALFASLFFVNSRLRGLVQRHTDALQESEERFRTLVNQAADAFFLVAPDGRIVDVNSRACTSLGYDREELLAMTIADVDLASGFRGSLLDELSQGELATVNGTHRRRDGSTFPVEVRCGLLELGGRRYLLGLARDVTDRQRAEEERSKLEAQLRQSQKMEAVGQLAGGVAHDFNNILTAILGNVELAMLRLHEVAPGDEALLDGLQQISGSAERAGQLTRQLLAFGRRQPTQPAVLDLNSTLVDLEKMLRRLITEDIDLVTHLAPNLGLIRVDPGQVEQVIMNLVVNANDAMADGGALTIETRDTVLDEPYVGSHADARAGPHVLLAVSDTGCGMNTETLERIFEPFYTTKVTGQGTGLGLATVYGIVKQAGGHITAYSEPGAGSTFRVYFPTVEAAIGAVAPGPVERTVPTGTETLLVCEDDPAVRNLAYQILAGAGYTVLAAGDGAQARKLAAEHDGPIDLLVTDVIMPDLNGRRLAEQLSVDRPEMQTLFVSGYTSNVIALHCGLDEGVEFLEKPFNRRALLRRVREVLDRAVTPAASGRADVPVT